MPLTKYNNNSLSSLTALPAAIPTGKLKLISSQTASNSASISFTTGLSSTYKVYKFVFVNIHPRTDNTQFQFQGSTNGGSTYATTITSTFFHAIHEEIDTDATLAYNTNYDLAQSTSYQPLVRGLAGDADENGCGELYLFNPAGTTYVKHFIAKLSSNFYPGQGYEQTSFIAGYFNTTSAINAIQFNQSSGNIDGNFYLYAIDNS